MPVPPCWITWKPCRSRAKVATSAAKAAGWLNRTGWRVARRFPGGEAAEREVGLIEQAVAPHLRRNPSSRHLPAEVMQLVLHAHAAMLRSTLT